MSASRRQFLGTLAATSALAQSQPALPSPVLPNILLILSDDHSIPYLGAYGSDFLSTPNLDRLAADGMRFDRAFTAAPQCVPSRTAILTGRSPVAARMGRFSSPLPPDVVSAPELLRERGYFTGVCGRWFHLDGQNNPPPQRREMFDRNHMLTWTRRVDSLQSSPQQGTAKDLDAFIAKAPAGKPWFFWINYSDPHHAWDPKAGNVDPAKVKVPGFLPDLPGVRDDLARHCGEIERMDGFVGQALDVLRARGLDENTLVMFMGDNGMAFPHGKGSLYDPGLNVPLIVRWPGMVRPGSTTKNLISGEDLTPTFLEAAGIPQPGTMTGRSFLGLLTGGAYQPRETIFAARLAHGNSPVTETTKASTFDLSRCVRSDRYKLIYNCTPQMEYSPVDSAGGPGWKQMVAAHREGKLSPEHEQAYFGKRSVLELYDLDQDPDELHNLAGNPQHAEVQRALTLVMEEKMIIDYDFLPLPTTGQ